MKFRWACMVGLVFASLAVHVRAATYSIVEIAAPDGSSGWAYGFNNRGEVVGSTYRDGDYLPYIYGAQGWQLLPLPTGFRGQAFAINDKGTVVGEGHSADFTSKALLMWRNGAWEAIDNRSVNANWLDPLAINNDDVVVGRLESRSGGGWGFVLKEGKFTVLQSPGWVGSIAYGLNDAGHVVGGAIRTGDEVQRSVRWIDGVLEDLGSLGRVSAAHGINMRGQIVGDSSRPDRTYRHAFIVENGVMRDLDPDSLEGSALLSINAAGVAVGGVHIYREGRLVPVSQLLNPYSNWKYLTLAAINDSGVILGNGCRVGGAGELRCSAVLLVPLKAPLPAGAGLSNVVEFHNAALDHFFMSADPNEIAALDSGAVKGWARTGEYFRAFATAGTDRSPVCRFYIPPDLGDSHFFSASAKECEETKANLPQLVPETSEAFFVGVPDAAGQCPAGTVPIYRLWSKRADSNHRYTSDAGVRDKMVEAGWLAEGAGPGLAVMCGPP